MKPAAADEILPLLGQVLLDRQRELRKFFLPEETASRGILSGLLHAFAVRSKKPSIGVGLRGSLI